MVLVWWSLSCSATSVAVIEPLLVMVIRVGALMNDEPTGPRDRRTMFGVPLPEAPLAERTTLRCELSIRSLPPAGLVHEAYATLPIKSSDVMLAMPPVDIPRSLISYRSFFALVAASVSLFDGS